MTGYQEILTDPSYAGQLVTMTYPLIGNYGVNPEDEESGGPQVSGFVVREVSRVASSWRATGDLPEYLMRHGIVGISGVDTRALTRHIRAQGAMRGAIAPASVDPQELRDRVLAHPRMEGLDLAGGVSTAEPYAVEADGAEKFRVLAYDFGVKAHSPRLLAERGCRVTVIPFDTPAEEILAEDPDGLFVSNGPGDPAAVREAEEAILNLSRAGVPVFGICLGHQLIGRAFGGSTYKLPFGHHGGNHPVEAHRPRHRGDHRPKSWLRRPRRGGTERSGGTRSPRDAREPLRSHGGRAGAHDPPRVLGPIPSRGGPGAAR